ncbi:uncharacterized protein LOC134277479 [Saccostrea cucullata]|uniref:uncharacterized protein LOC134277479 n=1 Tax=Saccostrea cuccullata TaxID=36930 RepID=UPI002ED1B750
MDQGANYLMCRSHDKKLVPIYCEDCECPVCMKCMTTSHLQHKICDASVYVQKRHGELLASLHGENSMVEKMKNELRSKHKNLQERQIKLIEEISSREEAIIAEVRDIGKHLKETVSDAVSDCEAKIQKSKKEIEKLEVSEFDTTRETNCIKVLQCYSELRRLGREMKIHEPMTITFETVKSRSRRHVEELLGKIVVQHDLVQQPTEKILAVVENEKLGISMLMEKCRRSKNASFYSLLLYRLNRKGEANVFAIQKRIIDRNCTEVAKLCILKDSKSQVALICKTPLYVYDQQLNLVFSYHGSIQFIACATFSAAFACLDLDNNVLVSNKSDGSIHMLDIGGQFLRIVVYPEDGLSNLTSLSVDGEDWLWCTGLKDKRGYLSFFDYNYLKTTERSKRALTETEENF